MMQYIYSRDGQNLYINKFTNICYTGTCIEFDNQTKDDIDYLISLLREIKREKHD